MFLVHLLSFSLLCLITFANPFGIPTLIERQGVTPTAETAAESTMCGDIVIASLNGEKLIPDLKRELTLGKGYNVFFASDVYECLESVPFNGAVAARFIDYYNETLQFQSTLAFLEDPPTGYQQPPVNVNKILAAIKANATAGIYPNQYAFEADVQLLINRMHDSHVILGAGVLLPFNFASPYGIVSASVDGKKSPEIFMTGRFFYLSHRFELNETDHVVNCQQTGCRPSPITHINGVDVVDYLTQYAVLNAQGYLEPHADWNTVMDSPARDILGDLSTFQSGILYPGDSLNFTFKDQEPIDTYWLSIYLDREDTGPLATGGDFYNVFVLGLLPESYNATDKWWPTYPADNSTSDSNSTETTSYNCSSASQNWCTASRGAFPDHPSIAQQYLSVEGNGVVTGYIYDDISTGVLSMPSFAQVGNSTEYFQNAVDEFIGNATQRNMSHIIIDLQQNSGGTVYLAFEVFKRFFATIDPYAASRIRSHHLADVLGSTYTEWWDELEKHLTDDVKASNYETYASSEWVVSNRINTLTQTNFTSWDQYSSPAGPIIDHNDKFSIPQRYNLSDEIFDASAFEDWIPFGYGISKPDQPLESYQHWKPEDIVILTDGLCSSACALFVEMMTHQAGVRTIVIGGRPVTGPMQAVAGTRGARSYSADAIDEDISNVNYVVNNEAVFNSLPNRSDTGMFVTYAGFNIADQMRRNDSVPLQFKYEAADCRLYYTLANVYNMTQLWRDVSNAAWKDASLCVENSTGYPTARSGDAYNSTKSPPDRTAQTPSLAYDLATGKRASIEVNSTRGLFDFNVVPQAITPCNPAGQCLGNTHCIQASVNCGSSGRPLDRNVWICAPACQDPSGCQGKDVDCTKGSIIDSKFNSPDKSRASTPPNISGLVLREGHCTPPRNIPALHLCGK
jgi:hypothetical protein